MADKPGRPKPPLQPLIPLDDLKRVVSGLIRAPKPEKPESKSPG